MILILDIAVQKGGLFTQRSSLNLVVFMVLVVSSVNMLCFVTLICNDRNNACLGCDIFTQTYHSPFANSYLPITYFDRIN